MENALAMMNEEHRELLTLKFVQGLTNEEVGEITGQNASAVVPFTRWRTKLVLQSWTLGCLSSDSMMKRE